MNKVAHFLNENSVHARVRFYDPDAPKETSVYPRFLSSKKHGSVAKTLICLSGKQPYCLVLGYDGRADLKKLARTLNLSRFQFAKPEQVTEFTGYKIGSVSPVMPGRQLPTVFDEQLVGYTHLYLNAGQPGAQVRAPTIPVIELLNGKIVSFVTGG